jgi:hypothetical protein
MPPLVLFQTQMFLSSLKEQSAMSIWLSVIVEVDGKVVLKDRQVLV